MKNIIRLLLLFVSFATFSFTSMAQSGNGDKQRLTREQLADAQAKHIASELALDETTTNRFVSAYSKYQQEVWKLGPRPKAKKAQNSDAQVEKALKERFEHSQKILDLRKKYYTIYSGFLSQQQIQRVYQLERQMMQRLAKNNKRPNGGKAPRKLNHNRPSVDRNN